MTTSDPAFFHHFASKSDLAVALLERYARADARHLEEHLARAERLATDPLQQLRHFRQYLALFFGAPRADAHEGADAPRG